MDDLARTHHLVITHLLRTGAAPTRAELARQLGVDPEAADAALLRLAEAHGMVLHPGTCDPWVIHPFSSSPTAIWVAAGDAAGEEDGERGWWAPCTWCAFGIATLAGGRCTIHARLGGEAEELHIDVADGRSLETDLVVHFAIPPREAWVNVHHHCAMILPFRSDADIDVWSARHGLPRGESVPITRVAELARAWYGQHARPDWHEWSLSEAAALFRSVGLVGPFWELDAGEARF